MGKAKDITNQKFGRLTALYIDENRIQNNKNIRSNFWMCKCDCGNYVSVNIGHLTSGKTKSCGCIREKFVDLTNKTYGLLTVVSFNGYEIENEKGHKRRTWLCKCQCGNYKVYKENTLKNNLVKSCGCNQFSGFKYGIPFEKKFNNYDLKGDYGIGYDHNNNEFYFDTEDYDLIKHYCWIVKNNLYVESRKEDGAYISLHRLLMNEPELHVDHINHKPNDNRKNNLRIVTREQNQANAKLRIDNTSGIKGVYYNNRINKWVASLQENNISHSKNFDSKLDAINYRKFLEEKYQKEYSYDNSMKQEINLNL